MEVLTTVGGALLLAFGIAFAVGFLGVVLLYVLSMAPGALVYLGRGAEWVLERLGRATSWVEGRLQ